MGLDVSPLKEIELVSVNDSAIDLSGKGFAARERYIEDRDWTSLIPKLGKEFVRWRFAPLRINERAYVEQATNVKVRHMRAFQAAFRGVEGLRIDGKTWEPKREETRDGPGPLLEVALEELEACGLGSLINELGGVVLQRSYLDPFGGGKYSLPLGCVVVSDGRWNATTPPATSTTGGASPSGTAATAPPTT